MAIMFGMPLLVLFMGLVMGLPFIYHLRCDRKYLATRGQPDAARLAAWYAR